MRKVPSSNQTANIPICIAIGAAVGILLSLGLCAVASGLLISEKVGETIVPMLRYAIIALSAFSGAITGVVMAKRQYLIVSAAISAIFCAVLICLNILLFNSQFHAVIWCIVTALCSGVAAGVLPILGQGSGAVKRKKYRFG